MFGDHGVRRRRKAMKTLEGIACALILTAVLNVDSNAQKSKSKEPTAPTSQAQTSDDSHVRASAAYAEVLLRQTELSASLDALLEEYTDNYPKVIDTRLQLASISADLLRLLTVKPEAAGRLTSALGRLMVRRSELYSEYQTLDKQYDAGNPMVKRAKKAYESFSKSIDEILK